MTTRLFSAVCRRLFVEGVAETHVALVQQADGGHVGKGLADAYVRGREGPRVGAEQVQCPMTCSRSRIGRACTAVKPARWAAAANLGQRRASAARSVA